MARNRSAGSAPLPGTQRFDRRTVPPTRLHGRCALPSEARRLTLCSLEPVVDVERVQQRLVELNYLKNSTGYYGSDTEKRQYASSSSATA